MSRHTRILVLCLGLTFGGLVFANDVNTVQSQTVTGQFLTTENSPVTAQQDLLKQTFQVRFPIQVITVGDAVEYLLQTTGYSLVKNKQQYPFAFEMLNAPLPNVDRSFGPLTIEEGLQTLAGDHFQLIIDPVNRLIAFRLKPQFLTLYAH